MEEKQNMSATQTTYGDISPRTAAKAEKQLLKRADEIMVTEKFGQSSPLGPNETKSKTFRRYNALSNVPNELTEGVKPMGSKLTKTDCTATLKQYGDFVETTDVVLDTHEDPILSEATDLCGQQAGEMLEIVRFGVLLSGTNVFYAGGVAARNQVVGLYDRTLQRKVTTAMRKQRAKPITRVVKSSPSYGTEPVQAAYVGIIPVELDTMIRDMDGFVPAEKYGTETPMEGEIGKVEGVRYIVSGLIPTFPGEGGTPAGGAAIHATDGKANVYPILIIGADAYGIVPFKGKNGVQLLVRNPKPDSTDPLAQTGSVGWKALHAALILNELWMARVETAIAE